ncbi:sulfatase-like hydrolase/transferase [Halosimplex rubrum]|uniref:Sulfatase-like hydrolase/transferase n=1 Tax=Halosimplex rubrum TaxID=869889 RepID=A0A7D5T6U3_9EURY|nr:sulfatase-like hydrolase/transferase [Halosimplex rubrum]QLH78453.1 sulfatase-like hydrolase/transferase [Halosimplex rubrum]
MPDVQNVVVVMTDQQRADACAREGFPLDTTPFLDDLARDGAWFDRAYTSTPVCAPARASFLTGRFPTATNVWLNQQQDAASYERDLFDVANDAGFETALIGKNHSYLGPEAADHWVQYGHWGAQSETAEAAMTEADEEWEAWMADLSLFNGGGGWTADPTPTPVETQCAHRCISRAREWIESLDDDQPFFTWLSLPEPHNPYQVPEPYFSLFPPEELPPVEVGPEGLDGKRFKWRWLREIGVARALREAPDADYDEEVLPRLRSLYYGMCRTVDDQVRRFVEFLDEAGLREGTLLVFVSDHGDFVGQYGLMRKGVDLPEGTTRIPMIFDGPGVEPDPDPRDAHVSLVDVFPTICEAVGAEMPPGVQGRSLWPLLTGERDGDAFTSVYAECGYGGRHATPDDVPPLDEASKNELNEHTQTGRTAMVRRDDWKLVVDMQDGPELYDLAADPAETTDLSDDPDHATVLREMLGEFASWSLHVRDSLPEVYPIREHQSAFGDDLV